MTEKLLPIPRYISSFELEEARLGQALQATKTLLAADILKKVLIKIKDESINAEYALDSIAHELRNEKTLASIETLLQWFQKRTASGTSHSSQ